MKKRRRIVPILKRVNLLSIVTNSKNFPLAAVYGRSNLFELSLSFICSKLDQMFSLSTTLSFHEKQRWQTMMKWSSWIRNKLDNFMKNCQKLRRKWRYQIWAEHYWEIILLFSSKCSINIREVSSVLLWAVVKIKCYNRNDVNLYLSFVRTQENYL